MRQLKRIILPTATTAFSLYISFLFALGVLLGFLATRLFFKEFIDKGKIRSAVYLPVGGWRLHYHHWLMGATVFALLGAFSTIAFWPKIFLGLVGGVMYHDLHDYGTDWHRVIEKRKSEK